MNRPPWLAVDMDGTILSYESGMADRNEYGEPLPGAVDALAELLSLGWRVSVYTARLPEQVDEDAQDAADEVAAALRDRGVPFSDVWVGRKPRADVFLDDRAHRFTDWSQALSDLVAEGESHEEPGEDEREAWVLPDTADGEPNEYTDGMPAFRHDRSISREKGTGQ